MKFLFIFATTFIAYHGVNGEVVNGVDTEKACRDNQAVAKAYCRPTEDEPPAVKPKCDLYRKYCKDQLKTTPPPGKCKQIAYCSQYAGQNSLICSNTAFANASPDRQKFCTDYKTTCANVPEDPNDDCGVKKNAANATQPNAAVPNPFNGPPQTPGLQRLTDLNGGGPLATVGQSNLDNIPNNMVDSARSAPVFGILGHIIGQGAKTAAEAPGKVASGNFGSIGQGILSAPPPEAVAGPPNPTGAALGIQTVPGYDPDSQHGPFGTGPIWIGNSALVGPFAAGSQSTNVNPFGKVGWGAQQWGAMGFTGYRNANGVDYGSVPGLTDINNPLVGGKRRRRRQAIKKQVYRFLYKM